MSEEIEEITAGSEKGFLAGVLWQRAAGIYYTSHHSYPFTGISKDRFDSVIAPEIERLSAELEQVRAKAAEQGKYACEMFDECKRAQIAERDAIKRAEAAEAKNTQLRKQLNEEQNAHAELQARCFEGYPSASEGIFDYLRSAEAKCLSLEAEISALRNIINEK